MEGGLHNSWVAAARGERKRHHQTDKKGKLLVFRRQEGKGVKKLGSGVGERIEGDPARENDFWVGGTLAGKEHGSDAEVPVRNGEQGLCTGGGPRKGGMLPRQTTDKGQPDIVRTAGKKIGELSPMSFAFGCSLLATRKKRAAVGQQPERGSNLRLTEGGPGGNSGDVLNGSDRKGGKYGCCWFFFGTRVSSRNHVGE